MRSRPSRSTGLPDRSQIPAIPHIDRAYISIRMTRGRTAKGRPFLPGEGAARDLLQRLGLAAARRHRRRLAGTAFVGVTGSGGKTTTKDLVAAVLETELRGTKTPESLNRLTIVGRTILMTRSRHDFSVHEIPAFRPGSVAEFSALVQPTIAVVTRIGGDHRATFRTLEATAAEKRALVDAVPPDGTLVVNADDPYAIAMADGFSGRVISFGSSEAATLRAADVLSAWPDSLSFTLFTQGHTLPVRTRLYGRHWTVAILAAISVGQALGVPLERALEAVASFEPVAGRMSVVREDGIAFVRDDLKAPLWSLDTVLEFLAEARAQRKILVLGTISDYPGDRSSTYVKFARRALEVADEVVFVGRSAPSARRLATIGGAVRAFETVREAADHFGTALRSGDLVVLKGSNRADHLVRIVLARTTRVRCWRQACGRVTFCEDCRLLRVP